MEATGISHIAICVRDLDKSLEFYRDILGMKVLADRMQDTTTGGLPHVHKHSRKTRRQVRLAYGEGAIPTLTMTCHPGEEPDGEPIKLDQIGISHISFTVKDVKALAEELIAKGVPLAGPMDGFTNPRGEVSSIFVYDPDGILVQFDSGGGG
ncbi:MAG TPA: VOC family protein [Dehalococcoidia bacterium]|jgi:lactoylglutathione lyase|nr:VOC family protein [Dehalococcoidia bacterium]